jgi:hypothetical protein
MKKIANVNNSGTYSSRAAERPQQPTNSSAKATRRKQKTRKRTDRRPSYPFSSGGLRPSFLFFSHVLLTTFLVFDTSFFVVGFGAHTSTGPHLPSLQVFWLRLSTLCFSRFLSDYPGLGELTAFLVHLYALLYRFGMGIADTS